MLKRPLILKLFALFLVLDPILRVILLSIEKEFDFTVVLQKSLNLPVVDLFNFWLLFPVSGVLLLGVKMYSYMLFIAIQFYSLFFHINYVEYSWPYLSQQPSVTAYILLFINLFMVVYLLMPRSREIFFNKDLRWWERGSRYTIEEPCFVKVLDKEVHGKVCDISFGGALLSLDEPIAVGNIVKLDFEIIEKNLSLNGQIVREVTTESGEKRFGIQFLFESSWQKLQLRFLMLSIAKLNAYEKYR
ncbi:MAG: hypothetical protein CME62_03070 [Halobacteriovoraceae bacterium]|nr:hypothetical protein [Halobacteriovoraceae bacterium]|tara:strand:- start:6026 stop:6760 length:735 start_codon:yes stop_codon:yes gene_type:complete